MNLETALKIVRGCEAKALQLGKPGTATVTDAGGHIVAQHRMDGAILGSLMLSGKKAYTAVALCVSTDRAAAASAPGAPLYGIQHTGEYIVFGGGVPVMAEGKLVGGVGFSGGSPAEDNEIAMAGIAAIQ